jgi:hypothetical protein
MQENSVDSSLMLWAGREGKMRQNSAKQSYAKRDEIVDCEDAVRGR